MTRVEIGTVITSAEPDAGRRVMEAGRQAAEYWRKQGYPDTGVVAAAIAAEEVEAIACGGLKLLGR